MTDITVRQTVSNANSGAAASVTIGAGTAVNDVLLAIGTSNFFSLGAFGPPSGGGWLPIRTVDRGTDDSKIRCWFKPVTSGGGATITLAPIADEEVGLAILVLQDASHVAPIEVALGAPSASATPSVHVAPSVPVASSIDRGLLVGVAATAVFGGGGTYTPPGSMTERVDLDLPASAGHFTVATEQLTAGGATGTRSFTYSTNARAGLAMSIVVRPADFVAPSTPYMRAVRAATQQLTSATSTAVDMPSAGNIAAGNVLVARWAGDNSGSNGAATTVSVTDPRSNSWTVGAAANQDPGAANAGVSARIAYAVATNAYTNGDDLTLNYGNSTSADAVVVEEWAGLDTTNLVGVAQTTANGVSGTPSVSRTPTAAGQLVLGSLAVEGPGGDAYTPDADTTDGSWVDLVDLHTTSATAESNVTVRGAAKLVAGTTAQTWNPTITSRDWAAVALVFNAASVAVPEVTAAVDLSAALAGTTQADHDVTGSVPLDVAVAASSAADHDATTAVQLDVTVTAASQIDHDATAAISLDLALTGTVEAPIIPPAEVTASIPLDLTVAATSGIEHDVTAGHGLDLTVTAATAIEHQATAGITADLTVTASTETSHQATTGIPLAVELDAETDAPGIASVTASIPVVVAIAGTAQTDHQAAATVPLAAQLAGTASVQHNVSAAVPVALTLAPATTATRSVTAALPLTLVVTAVTAAQDPARPGTAAAAPPSVASAAAVAGPAPTGAVAGSVPNAHAVQATVATSGGVS